MYGEDRYIVDEDDFVKNKKEKAVILGVGLDGEKDGVRITRGENFYLYGGSEKTHTVMQEKAMTFNDILGKRKKKLDDLSHEEFLDIADQVGLKKLDKT